MSLIIFLEFGYGFLAYRFGIRTTSMETATLGWIKRAGNISLKNCAVSLHFRVRNRDGR